MFQIDERSCVNGSDPDELAIIPDDESFLSDYMLAPDLERIGKALIRERSELHDVEHASMRYMWRRKHGTSSGKTVMGKCLKLSGPNKAAADGVDFLLFVAVDVVRELQMTNWELEALVYHELNHVEVVFKDDGEPTFKVRGHDVELFRCEVEEYGLWRPNLKEAAETFRQLALVGLPGLAEPHRMQAIENGVLAGVH